MVGPWTDLPGKAGVIDGHRGRVPTGISSGSHFKNLENWGEGKPHSGRITAEFMPNLGI